MADNSSRKFKFISPGVFIDEVDNSQLPATPAAVGPVVVGTAAKGPGMTPITVSSFSITGDNNFNNSINFYLHFCRRILT